MISISRQTYALSLYHVHTENSNFLNGFFGERVLCGCIGTFLFCGLKILIPPGFLYLLTSNVAVKDEVLSVLIKKTSSWRASGLALSSSPITSQQARRKSNGHERCNVTRCPDDCRMRRRVEASNRRQRLSCFICRGEAQYLCYCRNIYMYVDLREGDSGWSDVSQAWPRLITSCLDKT